MATPFYYIFTGVAVLGIIYALISAKKNKEVAIALIITIVLLMLIVLMLHDLESSSDFITYQLYQAN